jgi:putative oxidoreductase
MNTGLLLLHGFLGAALVAHALQKLIVFRFAGTTGYVRSLGLRAPRFLAAVAIANELVGGALVGLGLLLPLGAALIASTMLVAARTDHRGKGWFITGAGAEYVVTNAVIAVALTALGDGRYSLDSALGLDFGGIGWALAVAAAAIVSAGGIVATFRVRDVGAVRGVDVSPI